MATQLFSVGWEMGLIETPVTFTNGGTGIGTVTTTKTRTGTYSLGFPLAQVASYGRAIPSTTELRANVAINHNGFNSASAVVDRAAIIYQIGRLDGTGWRFTWQNTNRLFYVTTIAAPTVALASGSEVQSNWTMRDSWHDMSIAIKVDGAAGWLKLYANGIEVLSFTGNTGTSPIVSVAVGGSSTSADNIWSAFAYFDDFYVEDTTGEAAAPAVNRKFMYCPVNGNGSSSTFVGNDGNSTDNYLLVDDTLNNDGDTTYVAATAAAQEDLYTHATVTTPVNHVVSAITPTVIARKTNAAIDTEIQLELFKAATDSVAAAQNLTTGYHMIFSRFTALPDASALNDANINSTEIGYISAGAYA